jgi:hypothetical protein
MDIKSKILLGILGVIIVLSVSTSYYRFLVLHDYIIETEIDCDPAYESCFTWECDSEEEECTGNSDEDTWYYKIAYRNAKNIPTCDMNDEACDQFTCPEGGEAECREVLCSEVTLNEYGIDKPCTVPEDFLEPIEEGGMSEETSNNTNSLISEDENSLASSPTDEI